MEFGLDQVDVVSYDVLLSYPNMTVPNKVFLMDGTNGILYNTSGIQAPLQEPEEGSSLIAPNFNAYSGTGVAEVSALFQFDFAVFNDVFVSLGWLSVCLLRPGS